MGFALKILSMDTCRSTRILLSQEDIFCKGKMDCYISSIEIEIHALLEFSRIESRQVDFWIFKAIDYDNFVMAFLSRLRLPKRELGSLVQELISAICFFSF